VGVSIVTLRLRLYAASTYGSNATTRHCVALLNAALAPHTPAAAWRLASLARARAGARRDSSSSSACLGNGPPR